MESYFYQEIYDTADDFFFPETPKESNLHLLHK